MEELTIHACMRAPWSSIARSLFHDAVKIGSLTRLKLVDYHLTGSSQDELVSDICEHCPDLRELRLPPWEVWQRNPQAKYDFIAMMQQPCWPKLEWLDLESFIPVYNFPLKNPDTLAQALTIARFPSLTGLSVSMKGELYTDKFIWDVLTNTRATVVPRLRDIRITAIQRDRTRFWSSCSYQLPNSIPMSPIVNNLPEKSKMALDQVIQYIKDAKLSSLQSLSLSDTFLSGISNDLEKAVEAIARTLAEKCKLPRQPLVGLYPSAA